MNGKRTLVMRIGTDFQVMTYNNCSYCGKAWAHGVTIVFNEADDKYYDYPMHEKCRDDQEAAVALRAFQEGIEGLLEVEPTGVSIEQEQK